MKLTPRERVLVLVLPLAVVLGGYLGWYRWKQRPPHVAIERALREAESKAVSPQQVREQEAAVRTARQAREAVEAEKVRLTGQIAALRRHPASVARRMQSLCALTALFQRHRLQMIAESSTSGTAPQLPKRLTEALARIDSPAQSGAGGELRSYKLSGTFADLMQAIEELAADESSPGVPVSLAMDEVDSSGPHRTWTLLIWM